MLFRSGHKVLVHDIKLDTKIDDLLDSEIIYVCVPTPENVEGNCDTSIVESVIHELNNKNYGGIVGIKSTVKPTTTEKLIKDNDLQICFVPEFLRERCAISDFVGNHTLLAVGTTSQFVYDAIVKCHGSFPKNYKMLTPTEAELLKYYSNVYNALRIVFANEMFEICNAVGADYSAIKYAFIKRDTAKDIYLDVNDNFRGFGGMCLPKDTAAINSFVKELNLDLGLFEMIINENKKFKTTVLEGMRLK